ncbi:MAG: ABC transporter substrate-binding protein, partial [Clostridiales bacterium]|nr:ABC transporter substrate-binding protein [Clostridiales bacterium]
MARLLVVFALALAMTRPAMAMSVDEALSAESSHYENLLDTSPIDDKIPNYPEYIQGLDAGEYAEPIVIEAVGVSRYVESGVEKKPEILADYLGESGQSLLAGEDSLSLFEFEVKTPGLYTISARHCPVAGKNATISRAIFLDGALPYKELSLIEFSRVWTDGAIMGPNGKVWEQDNQGNDRRPSMQEAPEWMDEEFFDSNGYVTESLQLNLSKGKHVLALLSVKEPMLLKSLTLKKAQELPSYEEVARSYPASSGLPKESAIVIQGESASKTSSQMLYPSQDTSAPSISPSSAKVLKNNSIGGNSWRRVGQWIEWDFEISNSGVYNISAHVKQNFQRGAEAARIISIDGKVPFKEMGGYGFGY